MNAETFLADIPLDVATAAHHGTSFTPDKRGEQERSGYAEQMAADYAELLKLCEGKLGMDTVLENEFARYREGYRQRYLDKLRSDSRCLSWMITGPSNFPSARNEKRNRIAHRRLEELLDFRTRALAAIRKTLCPELRPIMSGDADACERLKAKLEEAEAEQERMKAVNAILRKYLKKDDAAGQAALVALGYSEATALRYFTEKDCFGGYGHASFELTNNQANIRRMRTRLEAIQRNQSAPTRQVEGTAARLEDCPAENRVRLFFPGKPDASVRTRLKSSGFRWTPTLGCWQAYRNSSTIATAQRESGAPVQ